MIYNDSIELMKDIEKTYIDVRWNNQFRHMGKLPSHIQDVIDKNMNVYERHSDLSIKEQSIVYDKTEGTSTELIKLGNKQLSSYEQHSIMDRHSELISQKPAWHAPWKLMRVINGHMGWVRCMQSDPVDNEWFATGSSDSTIKIWDLASGKLKVTLSGHIMSVRDIAISKRHPYLFSASEDKQVKCWDLEKNMIIRDYHGHLSGVHTVAVHPTLDFIASAGRDSVVRLWDIRTRVPAMTLVGHKNPISKVKCTPVDPQIISCSTDGTVRLWDVVAGKSMKTLTHHKRAVRDIELHPSEFSLASACTDDIRSWKLPEGSLLTNFGSDSTGIINTLSINQDDILVAGGDDGALSFYDYKSGHKYQSTATTEIPGSLESERGILCSTFDQSGLRLITGETDKSIKVWKQIENANEETHPNLPWSPLLSAQRF